MTTKTTIPIAPSAQNEEEEENSNKVAILAFNSILSSRVSLNLI
jgi:hypothetical protein